MKSFYSRTWKISLTRPLSTYTYMEYFFLYIYLKIKLLFTCCKEDIYPDVFAAITICKIVLFNSANWTYSHFGGPGRPLALKVYSHARIKIRKKGTVFTCRCSHRGQIKRVCFSIHLCQWKKGYLQFLELERLAADYLLSIPGN